MILDNFRDNNLINLVDREGMRQQDTLSLVASESLAPKFIQQLAGGILTNRTFEGYPGKRYYAGGEFFDQIETLAIDRAKDLFGAEHANVQPHCGANTNLAVYHGVLKPGDTILAMDLSAGGHLSHGHPMNISSSIYKVIHYGVSEANATIDYDIVRDLAKAYSPRLIIGGTSSYPRLVDWEKLSEIAHESGSLLLADVAHTAGLIAAGVVPSPVPYSDFVTFSCYKTLPGPRGGCILCRGDFASIIDKAVFPGIQGSLNAPLIAAKAACFELAKTQIFKDLAGQIIRNSKVLAATLQNKGFKIVTGGTDTHRILVDLSEINISGKDAEKLLEKSGVNVNRNVIPFEKKPPWIASGIRLGTTVVTLRGFKEENMEEIGDIIAAIIKGGREQGKQEGLKNKVRDLCRAFPI